MSEKDRKLIKQSILIENWQEIEYLEKLAESDDCKHILLNRKKHLQKNENRKSKIS